MIQEKGSERVQQICDQIRKETLEPALQEAQEVISKARNEEKAILAKANKEASSLLDKTRAQIKKETEVFESSCRQAFDQVKERLQEEISSKLLEQAFHSLVGDQINKTESATHLVQALTSSINSHGQDKDFSIHLSKAIDSDALSKALAQHSKDTVEVQQGNIQLPNGLSLNVKGDNYRIDVTSESVLELISPYISQRFKNMIFKDKD